jgi:Clp protease
LTGRPKRRRKESVSKSKKPRSVAAVNKGIAKLAAGIDVNAAGLRNIDALLVSIVHFDVESRPRARRNFLFIPREGRAYPGHVAVELLEQLWIVQHVQHGPLLAVLSQKNLERRREKAQSLYGPNVRSVIESGRLQQCLLLNSPGGLGTEMDCLLRAMGNINDRGGQTAAFATSEAQSAAGNLLLEAKPGQRFALPHTVIMLHAPHSDDPQRDARSALQKQLVETETAKFFAKLSANARSGDRKALGGMLAAALENPKNPQNDIHFLGHEAEYYGFVQCLKIEAMEARFREFTGLPVQLCQFKDPISEFFHLSRVEAACFREFKILPELQFVRGKIGLKEFIYEPGRTNKKTRDKLIEYANAVHDELRRGSS